MGKKLSSQWGSLSPHLLASIRAVGYDGVPVEGEPEVVFPILDGASLTMAFNWQSQFENMGPESKAPALVALAQSGALIPLARRAAGAEASLTGGRLEGTNLDIFSDAQASLENLRGAAGITKINSTQIFNGMPPVKFSITALFRAWSDAYQEVEAPIRQLAAWAVPQLLADQGVILGNLSGQNSDEDFFSLKRLLPSRAPQLLQLTYGGRRYPPVVIENWDEELTAPRTRDNHYREMKLPLNLATLTALDRKDLAAIYLKQTVR